MQKTKLDDAVLFKAMSIEVVLALLGDRVAAHPLGPILFAETQTASKLAVRITGARNGSSAIAVALSEHLVEIKLI